jgi:agmatine deiminase
MRSLDADDDVPVKDGFYMPAEWAPHTRTWMQWPCRTEAFGGPDNLAFARIALAEVARTIARFEPVTMVARPQDRLEAQMALGPKIGLLEAQIDDSWARDTGATFLVNGEKKLAGVQWRFNAWGNKYHPFAHDAAVAGRMIESAGARRFDAPLVCEGGAIHSDGRGTLMTTEQCLLNENRNPELTRQQIEARLALFAGALRIVWLGDGFTDTETDGHIDNIACFAPEGRVLLGVYADKAHPNYTPALESLRRLNEARDAQGKGFEVVEIVQPPLARDEDGRILERSYINFYVCNGAVIVPAFGETEDEPARAAIAAAFPGREIVQVEASAIVRGGGGIHCITQQEPAA